MSSLTVVIAGAGVGGLAAALGLSAAGAHVELFDQDPECGAEGPRAGVPQSRHLHNLLSGGQQGLEALAPGFLNTITDRGAQIGRVAQDTAVFEFGTWMPRRDLGLRILSVPRPLIDQVLLEKLARRFHVTPTIGKVLQVELDDIGGVAAAYIDAVGGTRRVPAQIFVDATAGGLGPPSTMVPETTILKVNRAYASAIMEPTSEVEAPFILVFPADGGVSGLISPIADGRIYVSLSWPVQDAPGRTISLTEFRAVAARLEENGRRVFHDTLNAAALATGQDGRVPVYRQLAATWLRYDLLEHLIPGYLVAGDAYGRLNPLAGQGITTAARQAGALKALFAEFASRRIDRTALTQRYFQVGATAITAAWRLDQLTGAPLPVTGPAVPHNGCTAPPSLTQIMSDTEAHLGLVRMWHLLDWDSCRP